MSKAVGTVYLNQGEQEQLLLENGSLRARLADSERAHAEHLHSLHLEYQNQTKESSLRAERDRAAIEQMTESLSKAESSLAKTTREYLSLCHSASKEKASLAAHIVQLKNQINGMHAAHEQRLKAETEAVKRESQREKRELERINDHLRRQLQSKEDESRRLHKEQSAVLLKAEETAKDAIIKMKKIKEAMGRLEKRRNGENEGFLRDVGTLRAVLRQLQAAMVARERINHANLNNIINNNNNLNNINHNAHLNQLPPNTNHGNRPNSKNANVQKQKEAKGVAKKQLKAHQVQQDDEYYYNDQNYQNEQEEFPSVDVESLWNEIEAVEKRVLEALRGPVHDNQWADIIQE